MSKARLTDVAEHQQRPNFARLKREDNISGAAAKMSEGWGFVDPDGVRNLIEIVKAELVPIAYHFFWHGPPGKNGKHQAEFLVRQIRKAVKPELVIPCLDVEISSSMSRSNYPKFYDIKRWANRTEELLPGKRICIYSGYYWREYLSKWKIADLGLKRRPIIWDAHYFHSSSAPAASFAHYQANIPNNYWNNPAFGGAKANILQFSDRVEFSEFTGDADLADADQAELRSWTKAA